MKTLHALMFSTISRWLFGLAVCIVPQAVGAATWQVLAGAQSSDMGRQALAFLPNELWVHAGDSITWTFPAADIHTVTFLSPGQTRPSFPAGCPGTTPNPSSFNGSTCVNSGVLLNGQAFTVTFPSAGNFKLVCLVHEDMTGVVHVLAPAEPLPYDQAFYDAQALTQQSQLLGDGLHLRIRGTITALQSLGNAVTAGIGEISATGGGKNTVSVMRFLRNSIVVQVGDTVEWTNLDPITPHTVTFGAEPASSNPPSSDVTLDTDGARHTVLPGPSPNVHSGFLVAAPQERFGLSQAPLTVTRFRVTFTTPGTFNYYCALHDQLNMIGRVVVQE